MAVRIAHRAEHLLVRVLEAATAAMPEAAADRLGAGVGALVRRPLGIRREVVGANLRRAFPEASDDWVERTMAAAYRHLGREAVAMMRLSRLRPDQIAARTEMEGWDEFADAAGAGRGVVLATGHFGNWEIGAAAIAARGLPTSAIVKGQSNPLVNARLDAARTRLGVRTIHLAAAPRLVPRALRAGHVVGIVADQDARGAGIRVPFFGVPSSVHRGPALFAIRLGAPVFAGAVFRLSGELRYRVVLQRVAVPASGDLEARTAELTAELTARLEASIRRAPEQYFWFHRRWKSVPAAELAADFSGTSPSGSRGAHSEKDQA